MLPIFTRLIRSSSLLFKHKAEQMLQDMMQLFVILEKDLNSREHNKIRTVLLKLWEACTRTK